MRWFVASLVLRTAAAQLPHNSGPGALSSGEPSIRSALGCSTGWQANDFGFFSQNDHGLPDSGSMTGPYTRQDCIDMCNSIEECIAFTWHATLPDPAAVAASCSLVGGSAETNAHMATTIYLTYIKTCTGGSNAPPLECTEGFVELPEGQSCNTPADGYGMVATSADCERHAAATSKPFHSKSTDQDSHRGGCWRYKPDGDIYYNAARKDVVATDPWPIANHIAVCCSFSWFIDGCKSLQQMTADTNECVGSSPLTSKPECDAAANRLSTSGKTSSTEETDAVYPKGCYRNNDHFFWNTHTDGAPNRFSNPICCANPPESGANPPESSSSKSNTGLIIGVSLGAVVLVAVVGCILSVRRSGQTIGGNDWRNKLLSLI